MKGLAVDIDETLSNTVLSLMGALQSQFGNPEGLTPLEMVAKYRYTQRVPYWKNEAVDGFVRLLCESDDLQRTLPLIEDCDHYLQKISRIIPIKAYLTMRPSLVIDGTRHWLESHGFPKAPVIARPSDVSHEQAPQWKADTLERGGFGGLIDDYEKIPMLLRHFDGTVFLYGHSVAVPSMARVVPCEDWKAVYEAVKAEFGTQ